MDLDQQDIENRKNILKEMFSVPHSIKIFDNFNKEWVPIQFDELNYFYHNEFFLFLLFNNNSLVLRLYDQNKEIYNELKNRYHSFKLKYIEEFYKKLSIQNDVFRINKLGKQ